MRYLHILIPGMCCMVDRLIAGSNAGEGHRRTLGGGNRHPRHVGDPGRSNLKVTFGSAAISEYKVDTYHTSLVTIVVQWRMWFICTRLRGTGTDR